MSERAKVDSTDELAAFRGFLIKLADELRHALGVADADLRATGRRLTEERPRELAARQRQIARRLEEAEAALRQKRFAPTATGDPADVGFELKQRNRVRAARDRTDGETRAVRRLAGTLDRVAADYRGATQGVRAFAEAGVRAATERLDRHLDALADYRQARAAAVPAAGAAGPGAGAGVSRPAASEPDPAGDADRKPGPASADGAQS